MNLDLLPTFSKAAPGTGFFQSHETIWEASCNLESFCLWKLFDHLTHDGIHWSGDSRFGHLGSYLNFQVKRNCSNPPVFRATSVLYFLIQFSRTSIVSPASSCTSSQCLCGSFVQIQRPSFWHSCSQHHTALDSMSCPRCVFLRTFLSTGLSHLAAAFSRVVTSPFCLIAFVK